MTKTSKILNQQTRYPQSETRIVKTQKRGSKKSIKGKSFSTSMISNRKRNNQKNVHYKIKRHLKRISQTHSKEDNLKRLQSLLNVKSEQQIAPSALNIPSIENMISLKDIKEMEEHYSLDSGSLLSFNECISYRILQSEPELMLTYGILVERALGNLGLSLSSRQNEKVIKGVWNLLIKYWKDGDEQNRYKMMNEKIEWGLFELLNFDLYASCQERMKMEMKIQSLQNLDI